MGQLESSTWLLVSRREALNCDGDQVIIYLPCHATVKYQKVKCVICTKGLYCCDIMGTERAGNGKGGRGVERRDLYIYKTVSWKKFLKWDL